MLAGIKKFTIRQSRNCDHDIGFILESCHTYVKRNRRPWIYTDCNINGFNAFQLDNDRYGLIISGWKKNPDFEKQFEEGNTGTPYLLEKLQAWAFEYGVEKYFNPKMGLIERLFGSQDLVMKVDLTERG